MTFNGPIGSHLVSKGPLAPNGLPVPFPSTIPIPIPSNAPIFNHLPGPSNRPVLTNLPLHTSVSVPINPPVPSNIPTQTDRDVLTRLPKSLLYYGQSKWFVFHSKFERYARVQDCSDANAPIALVGV
ncbi:hypothetical protein DPMN_037778 [Dreissena polymorpha]|uniref:Uncharacterized protein n=1 Tax=Dreissena polymorpha TaxID=45954 RepID=A0A9D4MD72_DREPO|nr:hypothetical protein DPMN_037778 [Dreissena polymorpha]